MAASQPSAPLLQKILSRKRPADDLLGQLGLVRMIKIVRDMDQRTYLVTHRGHHFRMAMPDVINPPAREKIEILLARYIHERHPLALDENHRRAGIGGEDIIIVSFKNLGFFHIVTSNQWPEPRIWHFGYERRNTVILDTTSLQFAFQYHDP